MSSWCFDLLASCWLLQWLLHQNALSRGDFGNSSTEALAIGVSCRCLQRECPPFSPQCCQWARDTLHLYDILLQGFSKSSTEKCWELRLYDFLFCVFVWRFHQISETKASKVLAPRFRIKPQQLNPDRKPSNFTERQWEKLDRERKRQFPSSFSNHTVWKLSTSIPFDPMVYHHFPNRSEMAIARRYLAGKSCYSPHFMS